MADGYEDAAKKLGEVAEALHSVTDAQLAELGHAALAIIVTRTKAGIDAYGEPFAPYAPATIEQRQKKHLQTDHVDLAQTGHMAQAVWVAPGDGAVTLGFVSTREAEKAVFHNDGTRRKATKEARKSASAARKKQKRWYRRLGRSLTGQRARKVQVERGVRMPRRYWFDVRSDRDVTALTEMVGYDVAQNIEKTVNKK